MGRWGKNCVLKTVKFININTNQKKANIFVETLVKNSRNNFLKNFYSFKINYLII